MHFHSSVTQKNLNEFSESFFFFFKKCTPRLKQSLGSFRPKVNFISLMEYKTRSYNENFSYIVSVQRKQ